MPELAILDGHSIAYRAFFALPEEMQTVNGQVTNAVYGFTRMLIRLLGDRTPERVVVAWDVSRKTFRTEEYGEYKAQRAETPDAFKSQVPLIREILDRLGIPQIDREGFEADDLIASLGSRAVSDGWDVVIVTGDRDSFQLINDGCQVLYMKRGISETVLADASYVRDRYGIDPASYVDFASLRGDPSDNLPGVPGVGEKTAAKLISSYNTLEGVYDQLDEQTPRLKENLENSRDQVFLNRRLMTLVDDLELEVPEPGEPDLERIRELFSNLEFTSLWDDLRTVIAVGEKDRGEPVDCSTVRGDLSQIPEAGLLICELVSDDPSDGLAVVTGETAAVVVEPSEALFEGRRVVAFDAKRVLKITPKAMPEVEMDVALAAYVVDPGLSLGSLDALAEKYLGAELGECSEGTESSKPQGAFDFSEGPNIDQAGRRAIVVRRLYEFFKEALPTHGAEELMSKIEIPLIGVLARMELTGIRVDREYLVSLGEDLRSELTDLEKSIHRSAGEVFNINSSAKLGEILFDKLGLPILKKTATGKPSTDASVLERLDHPVVADLLRYRELEKLRSTYVDGYVPLIGTDGRIHTTFNQMAAATGRLSSESPNLQNIPVRSETGRLVRRAFVASPGYRFVVADYSQIELRVLAHMSEDEGLVEAFRRGEDIHSATASRVFGVEADAVTGEMRRMAKVINFGLLYGMESYGLSERLGIDRSEARTHVDAYFQQFPGVKDYLEGVVEAARRDGFTETMFGRRRYLPELKSDNFRVRQMAERMALNAPIQGTAADIIKIAMIEVDQRLQGSSARLLLQIHDELVVEAPEKELQKTGEIVRSVMEGATQLRVPLTAALGFGANLGETKGE